MRPLYMLTCICRGQHAAVFGICTETVYIQEHVYMVLVYIHCLCRGKGGGGGGQVILKRTDNPRKECP